jgi:hypothetical protein
MTTKAKSEIPKVMKVLGNIQLPYISLKPKQKPLGKTGLRLCHLIKGLSCAMDCDSCVVNKAYEQGKTDERKYIMERLKDMFDELI